jgi:hypothetical protein
MARMRVYSYFQVVHSHCLTNDTEPVKWCFTFAMREHRTASGQTNKGYVHLILFNEIYLGTFDMDNCGTGHKYEVLWEAKSAMQYQVSLTKADNICGFL